MSDDAISALRDVARQLSLPESTVRSYRDAVHAGIPTVGRGRRRAAAAETLLDGRQRRPPGGAIFARLRSRRIEDEGG